MRGIVAVLIVLVFVAVAGATSEVQEQCGERTTDINPLDLDPGIKGTTRNATCDWRIVWRY